MQGALPVHQEHTTITRLSDCLSHPRVVSVAGYCGNGAREARPGAERTKLKAQMSGRRMGVR